MATVTTELQTTLPTQDEIQKLARVVGNPCVSILMRTHRRGPQTQQAAIRFKNLLSEAKQQLKAAGHDTSILSTIDSLVTNSTFWQHQSEGLAIYLTSEESHMVQLPSPVEDLVRVSETFFLLPLTCTQTANDYFVLALTWDEAKLLRFDGTTLESVETEMLPAEFHDIVLPRDGEVSLQHTSFGGPGTNAGKPGAVFHGQGEGEDKIRADREQYLSKIGDHVATTIYNTSIPLMIVGTSEVIGHFMATTKLKVDAKVEGSPSQWSDQELKKRVEAAAKDRVFQANENLMERFGAACSNAKGSTEAEEIFKAAQSGRIEMVIVSDNPVQLGNTNSIVCEVLRQGGEIAIVSKDQLPQDAGVAAIYRY